MSESDNLTEVISHGINSDYSSIERSIRRPDFYIDNETKKIQTILGPVRPWQVLSVWELRYLALSLIAVLLVIVLTITQSIVDRVHTSDPELIFAVLLIWTSLFGVLHVIQGIFRERAFELLAFLITILVVLTYIIINLFVEKEQSTLEKVRLLITCLMCPILIGDSFFLKSQYFKQTHLCFWTVGADHRMQMIWKRYFSEESLLELDFQLAVSASIILWMRKGMHSLTSSDWTVLGISAFVTIFWFCLGFFGMRFEKRKVIYIFFITSIIDPAIIIWNLVRYSEGPDDPSLEVSVYMAGVFALLVRIITVVNMYFVLKNFDQGFKQLVFSPRPNFDQNVQDQPNDRNPNV